MFSVEGNKIAVNEAGLPPRRVQEAETEAELVNRLFEDLSKNKGEIPAPGSQPSQGPTKTAQNLVKQGVETLSKQKSDPLEAVNLFTKALDAVLSRPLWESTQMAMSEVCQCLGPRSDAYMAARLWDKAYADASLLTLLSPGDPKSHFRKGMCLMQAGKANEAAVLLAHASQLDPGNEMFAKLAAKALEDAKKQ